MSKIIINLNDGTVCDLDGSVVVDLDTLDDLSKALWQEWQDSGNDTTASELGQSCGVEVSKFTNNELTYGNTMAFSGKALRQEVEERIEAGYDFPEYTFARDFTDEQFDELGAYILSSDYLWNVFNEEVSSGIRNYANDIMGRKI